MLKLKELLTNLTERDFICPTSLINVFPLSLRFGFLIPHYSGQPATRNSMKFKAVSWLRPLHEGPSPRNYGSYSRLCHVRKFGNERGLFLTILIPLPVCISSHKYPKLKLHSPSPNTTQYSHCR
jgi:hypothetical protein